ncbi:MAG: hypothetical protein FD134_94 [Gallionellaceae bacterium]|nr:MAG: hypothetical protein FD134_94 [Gallionellaceae bacterium]
MTFSQSDFRHIRWSLLAFLLILGVGSATILASESFVEQAQRDQKEARRQMLETRARLATAEADRENMRTYTLEYNALLERNVIGNDQRLDWVEGLDRIRQRHKVSGPIGFKYAILPQKTYTPAPALDSGNFELNRSDMTLQFDLLHEEQLTAFLDSVRSEIKGWFMLDKCALERTVSAPSADDYGATEQVRAECAGGWVTLRNRSAPK